eukprot:CAMPEP_0181200848 /NCGR_PEP_ID=MMETSP1096-20121128/17994_1 /TAXON_ID=156174 ORGANISM="Chrysochromulina ericina, Strain CCMP281" /NCGR_SAMPLE_ID=MMETSP1096 /ASSEMBLY_ACC=CAM_ASM_000453 /LENGTH=98 /DNA_ID=CAMNT_0023291255 /DNA_START=100 /DNA_END=396 /DNA_ORIENTATION=-
MTVICRAQGSAGGANSAHSVDLASQGGSVACEHGGGRPWESAQACSPPPVPQKGRSSLTASDGGGGGGGSKWSLLSQRFSRRRQEPGPVPAADTDLEI